MSFREERLDAILAICAAINSSLEPNQVFENVMETARQALGADASSLILEDYPRKQLFFVSSTGQKGEEVKKVRLPAGAGIGGWVIKHGETVRIDDAEADPRHDLTIARMTGYHTRAMMCVPIKLRDETLGALQVLNPIGRDRFDEVDQRFIEAISIQVAYALQNSRVYLDLFQENQRLRVQLGLQRSIVGSSPAIAELRQLTTKIAPTDSTVLITGESGTGKELVARAIHDLSLRRHGPFVAINCAAMPENLIESELFGHVKGAFTGAAVDRVGKFQFADGGTLFLDEIGDMNPQAQASLLRVLEDRQVQPVGSNRSIPVNVRVIAATNKKILKAIRDQTFREDLYYRVCEFQLEIPPLRDRIEDLPPLVEHILGVCGSVVGRSNLTVAPDAMRVLSSHRWPGNVRELFNVIKRVVLLKEGRSNEIVAADLPANLVRLAESRRIGSGSFNGTGMSLEDCERVHIRRVLRFVQGNKSRAAQVLGISRPTLDRKIKQYHLARTDASDSQGNGDLVEPPAAVPAEDPDSGQG